ncbi:MAG: hypothetical protein IT368_16765 [Candidatus Hydrogenedentes bacterium]|nr:hypothetical protein [Candidatus Hydrogenedentota bacterium]
MPHRKLDRLKLRFYPLSHRKDRVFIGEDRVLPDAEPGPMTDNALKIVAETAERLRQARETGASRMLTFGAHAIKNGLAPVFMKLIEDGWFTHLATNGAGIIHDWEFAFQGHSSEHVAQNVAEGKFGMWQETGFYLNLAINAGAFQRQGYGESVGRMVQEEGVQIPSPSRLTAFIREKAETAPSEASAAADLLYTIQKLDLYPGWMEVKHPFKEYGLQAAAYRLDVPFTAHPMFGHDIIYLHPMSHGAAIGRTAQRDFLTFANNVANLEGGVYLSIGSAVMSPMVFEKSMSMAQNLAIQQGKRLENHYMAIVDLQESHWDWSQGEPPEENPDYYLRYCKSFSRMGGIMRYASADNRDFLLSLVRALK